MMRHPTVFGWICGRSSPGDLTGLQWSALLMIAEIWMLKMQQGLRTCACYSANQWSSQGIASGAGDKAAEARLAWVRRIAELALFAAACLQSC